MEHNKIRFGVVGLGHIGKLHATILMQHRLAKLEAVCDADTSFRDLCENSNCRFFNSIESLLTGSVNFDVLSIATPNGLHEQHALAGLEAGKHVVIEKPMALSLAGCERIIDAAAQRKLRVFCVMQNRYAPAACWLKGLLKDNILGEVYMVNVSCYWNRDSRYYKPGGWRGSGTMDGGPLFTQFSHFIDAILWLFGDLQDICARFANFNHHNLTEFEDSGSVLFKFTNKGQGCFQYSTSCWDRNTGNRITVIGENGSVEIEGQYMENISYCHIKNFQLLRPKPRLKANYFPQVTSLTNHHFFFDDVIKALHKQANSAPTGADGLRTVDVIEKIYSLR